MNKNITILNAEQASELLQINPTTLKRKAKNGLIPGKKPGKKWIFVQEHLIEWLRGDYSIKEQFSNSVDTNYKETNSCHSQKEMEKIFGTSTSSHQMEQEYDALLKLK